MPPFIWRCKFLFLVIVNIYWLLLPACCTTFNSLGSLTVKPAVPFLMGSNLTLYCHIDKCPHPTNIYLEIEKKIVLAWKLGNCSAIFTLTNVQEPLSTVYCKKNDHGAEYYVIGTTLRSGLPPDKPHNLCCETTRDAHVVDCRWTNGKETYIPTSYNISIHTENGSLVYSNPVQQKEITSIPREIFNANTKYQLTVLARNHFGKFNSDPLVFSLKDIIIPEIPHITQVDFRNGTLAPILQWKINESSKSLEPYIRMRTANGPWKEEEVSEIGEGLVQVSELRPLTNYEFQVKTCNRASHQNYTNPPSDGKRVCSKWSLSFWKKSPDKALHVWRDLGMKMENGKCLVTVFWKPPAAEGYNSLAHHYEIRLGNGQTLKEVCPPESSQCSATVPLFPPTTVSAVTFSGASPPALVPLTQSGAPGPGPVTSTGKGSSVVVSWTHSEPNDKTLSYAVDWTTLPPTAMRWQIVSKHQREATITGLKAGVRYNISVYTVTTRGVSAPSYSVAYSEELKPTCGPVMAVMVHESKRVQVKWDELAVEQRKGFITSYTIYYYVLGSSSSQLSVVVPASAPRQKWLGCPEGTLALQMTASTSAGEGPRGNLISSHPPAPPVGLVIVIVFIFTFFVSILINLMCWKCVRERIKQKCISWGPEWLTDNLPNFKESNAIKLLELNRSDPSLFSTYNDPPLSPISFLSQDEREDMYPCVHVELGPLQIDSDGHLLVGERTTMENITMEDINYKPQATMFIFPEREEVQDIEEDNKSLDLLEGFWGGLLPNVQVDQSDTQTQLGLDAVHCAWWSKHTDTNIASQDKRTSNDKMESKSDLLLIQPGEIISDEALVDLSACVETLASGYFPQETSPLRPA